VVEKLYDKNPCNTERNKESDKAVPAFVSGGIQIL
jgi:hypothetical protein